MINVTVEQAALTSGEKAVDGVYGEPIRAACPASVHWLALLSTVFMAMKNVYR